jgi:hypothetical protein
MEPNEIKSAYLSALNDHLEVVPYGAGFLAWLPLRHSDDDAICLSIEPHNGGWLVGDQGSTLTRLQSTGAVLEHDRFQEAWARLSRPGDGFVPGDADPMEIRAWGPEAEVGTLLARVGEAALRAEGLTFMVEPRRRANSFGERVARRVQIDVSDRAFVRTNGKVQMSSGRQRQVTATVEREGKVLGAIQALGGQTKQDRQRSHDVAYAIFGPSSLPRDQRLVVANGTIGGWEAAMIEELRDVADVQFFDERGAVEKGVERLLANA